MAGSISLAFAGCQRGVPFTLENRTDTLMAVRVVAEGGRTLVVDHEDEPDAERLGQRRFASRPASGLTGLSIDQRSFGPMRLNPGEAVRFRVLSPRRAAAQTETGVSGPAIHLKAAPILSSQERDIHSALHEPLPKMVVIEGSDERYRFEVSDEYAPAFVGSGRSGSAAAVD